MTPEAAGVRFRWLSRRWASAALGFCALGCASVWAAAVPAAWASLAVLGVAGLVAASAQVAWPSPARSVPKGWRRGAAAFVLGGLALVAGQIALDLPFRLAPWNETATPVVCWMASTPFFLAGLWWLLDAWQRGGTPPACAACQRAARGPRCASCGVILWQARTSSR